MSLEPAQAAECGGKGSYFGQVFAPPCESALSPHGAAARFPLPPHSYLFFIASSGFKAQLQDKE